MTRKLKILLVDEESYRKRLARELNQVYGHEIHEATLYEDAVQRFEEAAGSFDLAIVDYSLEGERSGIELLERLHQIEPNLPVIIITGAGDRRISQQALQAGAFWYLDKPPDWVELEMLLKWVGRYRATSQAVHPQSVWGANLWMPVSDAIVSARTIPELVEAVRTRALVLLEAERCGILEVDPETGSISGWSGAEAEEQKLLADIFSPLARDMTPLDKPNLASLAETGVNGTQFRAWAACASPPARGATEILFALFEKELTEEQKLGLELKLVTLARLIGVALENLRKAKLLEAVVDSGRELLTVQDRIQVYDILKHQILDKLGVRTFYLALHNRSKDAIRCPFFYHQGEDIRDRIPVLSLAEVKSSESFTVYVLTTNNELTIEDPEAHSHPTQPYPVPDARARAYFAVPLRRPDSSAFGVLSIQSAVPRVFPESLKQAVRALASLVAPTLTRLRRSRLQEHILANLMSGDPRAVLQESLQSIWESVNADLVVFYPYDSRRQVFRLDRIQVSPPAFKIPSPVDEELPTLNRLLELGEHFSEEAATDEVFGERWAARYGTISVAGLALKPSGSNTPSGIVIVHYRSPHLLDQELQTDITRFSQFAAVATHLMQQQERRDAEYRQQEIIEQLVGISDSAQLARILEEKLKLAWPNVPVVCHLFLVDRGRRRLYSPLAPPEEPPIPFGDSHPAGLVADEGKSLLILNRRDSPSSNGLPAATASALYVPVKLGDSLLGALGLESSSPQVFDDMDRLALEEIAESAATALGAAGQGDHARAVIAAAARAAASDPEQELQVLAQSAHDIALIAGGAPTSTTVFLLTGQVLDLVAAWPPALFGDLQKKVGTLPLLPPPGKPRGIVATAVREKRSQFVASLPHRDYIPFDDQTRAELAVPVLAADGTVIGVLNLEYAQPEALNDEHRTLLERLADQAAIVAILQKQASLKQKQRATLVMLGVEAADSSHGWITDKSTVINSVALLRRLAQGLLEHRHDRVQRFLIWIGVNADLYSKINKIDSATERIELILAEPVSPSWMNEHIHQKQLIDIGDWLGSVKLYWSRLHSNIEFPVRIETSASDRIFANKYWLTRALRNLIQNAVRATNKQEKPQISIRSYVEGHSVFIEVWDNGPGIPANLGNYLFNTLVPSEEHDSNGHGTGCLLTDLIAQEYGGHASILPAESGARVALVLPWTKAEADKELSSSEG